MPNKKPTIVLYGDWQTKYAEGIARLVAEVLHEDDFEAEQDVFSGRETNEQMVEKCTKAVVNGEYDIGILFGGTEMKVAAEKCDGSKVADVASERDAEKAWTDDQATILVIKDISKKKDYLEDILSWIAAYLKEYRA